MRSFAPPHAARLMVPALIAAVTLAACRAAEPGTDGSPTASPSPTPTVAAATEQPTESPAEALIMVSQSAALGAILTDADGRTLYLFTNDEGTGGSTCTGGCPEIWPAFTVDSEAELVASADVTGELATTARDGGDLQVTIAGNPLYHFSGDANPGDTNGHGVGSVWFAVGPSGSQVGSGGSADYDY